MGGSLNISPGIHPGRSPGARVFDGRGTHLCRALYVATIGVVTSNNSGEPFPLQAIVSYEKLGWSLASGDGYAFLCFAGRSSIQLNGADRDLAKA